MKQIYLKTFLLALFTIFGMRASAYDVCVDGIYYDLNKTDKTASVTYHDSYSGDIAIPESIVMEGIMYNVTCIGEDAFRWRSSLTSIEIPNSVTSIGYDAFSGCSGLTRVNITDIAAWCNIDFEDYDSNPLRYAEHLYLNGEEVKDLIIPEGVTTISNFAFWDCTGLTSVEIPNSVTSIGNSAFSGCSGLSTVEIPNSVTSIGEFVFSGCSGLSTIEIPNSVTSIGEAAFSGCSGLTSIKIPNSVTTIGGGAFENCEGLISVNITDIAAWCKIKFDDSYYYPSSSNPLYNAHHLYLNGNEVKDLVIPDGVTSIGNNAFCGCEGLTSVEIPNSVTTIGDDAFWNCSGLTSVEIPNSVTSIGRYAFSSCEGLTSIEIPNSVTSIGYDAFSGCI